MLYQHLFIDDIPYFVAVGSATYFPPHVHHEIEIAYCLEGSFNITVNGQNYELHQNDFIFLQKMVSHEYHAGNGSRLMLEFGPVFLREHYRQFSELTADNPVISLSDDSLKDAGDHLRRLRVLFDEIISDYSENPDITSLNMQGNVCKICHCLLKEFSAAGQAASHSSDDIYMALDLVYKHYSEPITVDTAARISGYGKSNFCNIFKKSTGQTFHAYLNEYRVKKAITLLEETTSGIEAIGYMVGFNDPKTFSRVFKSVTGSSPKEYRGNSFRNS